MIKLPSQIESVVIVAAACVLLFAVFPVHAQSPQYTVRDLGSFTVRAMNDLGQAAGLNVNKPVLYNNGLLTEITPPAGVSGDALSINNSGHVAGHVVFCDLVNGNHVNCRVRGLIYRNGSFEVLGTLGGRDSQAFGINDAGQVTGWSNPVPLSSQAHAFIFQNGAFQDIGANIDTNSTEARSINSIGHVAGFASSSTENRGAFFYSNGNALFFETQGFATDVNDAGQVVGGYGGNDDGSRRAFLFSNGVRQDLGSLTPQDTNNVAGAVNNSGVVVGISSPSFFSHTGERAFIYNNGVMQDLNSMIPAGSGWVLNAATDINNAGQIVGNGKLNGQDRAFLLTPTEPLLLTDPTNQVIALESVSFRRGPFSPFTPFNLSSDQRTLVTLITRNIDFVAGENISPPTVEAEDSQHHVFPLPVEYFGRIPNAEWLTQIVVRLPENIVPGDLQISVSFRGRTSNHGLVTVTSAATP